MFPVSGNTLKRLAIAGKLERADMKKKLMIEGLPIEGLQRLQAGLAQRLSDQPNDPDIAWHLAETARAAGNLECAAKAYRVCLELDPTRLSARRRLAILDGLGVIDSQVPGDDRPVPFFLRRSVLPPESLAALWRIVTARSGELQPSRMAWRGDDRVLAPSYRHSLRMSGAKDVGPLLLPTVKELIATNDLVRRFGTRPLSSDKVEVEIANHGDSHFLRLHRDSGEKAASRTMTFVFYFFRQPQRFQGGDLLLHDMAVDSGKPRLLKATRLIVENNSLVIFPSDCWHQVLPVTGTSLDPLDGRWTTHGWFHA
jgi:hypothetical protein